MIVITGGAGFIGSNLAKTLSQSGELLIVEELDRQTEKFSNISDINYIDCIGKDEFLSNIKNEEKKYSNKIDIIFHLGACSKTTEKDRSYIMSTNFEYSKALLHFCANNEIPLIYASSASVYGASKIFKESPENESSLNHYAESKLLFDNYYREHSKKINSQVAGLRYFNVYGPRENHKKEMYSVVYRFYHQVKENNEIKLFKASHGYENGEQRRDFIHVDDTINVKKWLMNSRDISGIFNVGTGLSRSFNDVAKNVISTLGEGKIKYIDFPDDLESQYQAFTEANMSLLRKSGFEQKFLSVEQGVESYIKWLKNS
tara:strand:+ start:2058 stop:3005 length:948 start_codon:yes stop_codon:yes gene_type:complete